MPKIGLTHSGQLETRNAYTKVECEINVKVDGRELPSMEVIGAALEEANTVFQQHIKDSYKVPARVDTELAQVYAAKPTT
jgi:hypothetical protein